MASMTDRDRLKARLEHLTAFDALHAFVVFDAILCDLAALEMANLTRCYVALQRPSRGV